MYQINQQETNKHLISTGRELESALKESQGQFFHQQLPDGRNYFKPSGCDDWKPLNDPEAPTIYTKTLTGIANYLNDNPDGLDYTQTIVHVMSPTRVAVISTPFGGFKQRATHMQAEACLPKHKFDQYVAPDEFVPYLQSCFCESEDLAALIKISGNIVDTSEVRIQDDGVSQEVSIRQGAARKGEVPVPSPAILMPFSTFAEVIQPPRKFVFRLSSDPLKCALLTADGGAWELTAIESVAAWLRENLPSDVKVIA